MEFDYDLSAIVDRDRYALLHFATYLGDTGFSVQLYDAMAMNGYDGKSARRTLSCALSDVIGFNPPSIESMVGGALSLEWLVRMVRKLPEGIIPADAIPREGLVRQVLSIFHNAHAGQATDAATAPPAA